MTKSLRPHKIKQIIHSFAINSKNRLVEIPWITVLFTVGITLRISGFASSDVFYDEVFSLQMTRLNLGEMIQTLKLNISPPGFESILWFITRIFGWNVVGSRILSILASIATLWVIYKISTALRFTKAQKIASLTIVALLPYQLISAQQGRVYAIFVLIYLLGIYSALTERWILLGFTISEMLWAHSVAVFFIPGLILIALTSHQHSWRKIFIASALGVISYLPWLQYTFSQSQMSMPWFRPFTLEDFFLSLFVAFFGWYMPRWGQVVGMMWILLLPAYALLIPSIIFVAKSISRLFKYGFTGFDKKSATYYLVRKKLIKSNAAPKKVKAILLLAFMSPMILLLVTSILFKNIFIYRTAFLFTAPLILWLAYSYAVSRPNIFYKAVWLVSIFIIVVGVIYWNPNAQDGGFKGFYETILTSAQGGDAFYHSTGLSAMMFDFYFPQYHNYVIDGKNVIGIADLKETKSGIRQYSPDQISANRVWVVWTQSEDVEKIDKITYDRIRKIVKNCPLVAVLNYPQSWPEAVYLCNWKKY